MPNSQGVVTHYNVIIDSIGMANPAVSTVLADVLGLPIEVVARSIYNAPALLFSNVEYTLAEQSVELLTRLGITAHYQSIDQPVPIPSEPVEVGVYVSDIDKLGNVTTALADFLGSTNSEALGLLMNDPAIVLGSVSIATANALAERLDAEVIVSEPKLDLYTLVFDADNRMIKNQLETYLNYVKIPYNFSEKNEINNLSFELANQIWLKFQTTGMLKIINQSFQRYEIILDQVDMENPNYRYKLTLEFGMPDEVIDEVLSNLPVQLNPSVNFKHLDEKLIDYSQSGLICSTLPIKHNGYRLIIEENPDVSATKTILSQFIDPESIPTKKGRWQAPVAVSDLIFRCVAAQLEAIGCTVDYELA